MKTSRATGSRSRDPEFRDVVHRARVEDAEFSHGNLKEGTYYWRVASLTGHASGAPSPPRVLEVEKDAAPPGLQVEFPEGPVTAERFVLRGSTEPGASVFVSDHRVPVKSSGAFSHTLELRPGSNLVVVESIDVAGNVIYRSEIVNARYERSPR